MKKYEKPEVTNVTYSPEPVEAGCCLRSCGGSPISIDSKKKFHGLKERLDQASKMKKTQETQ
jgi:hypothetical protein